MEKHLVSFGIGLAAGLFGGLIGLGGGFIMIPLLVGWLKLDQCRAHGTSLAVLIFTGLSGAATYGWHGNVNWPAAIALAAPAVVTAAAGARLADRLPDWKLKRAFGVFLIFCSALLLLRPCFSAIADHLPAHIMLAHTRAAGSATFTRYPRPAASLWRSKAVTPGPIFTHQFFSSNSISFIRLRSSTAPSLNPNPMRLVALPRAAQGTPASRSSLTTDDTSSLVPGRITYRGILKRASGDGSWA